jgi:hypothetical protein
MELYSIATAYDFNDYSDNEMTRNYTGVSICHYCNYYYCSNELYYVITNEVMSQLSIAFDPLILAIARERACKPKFCSNDDEFVEVQI